MQTARIWLGALFLFPWGFYLGGVHAFADDAVVSTADQLDIAISTTGTLETLSVGEENLLPADLGEFYPVSIFDVSEGDRFVPVKGAATSRDHGVIVQEAQLPGLGLETSARFEAADDFIQVKLQVRDTSAKDRGLLVRFALPIDARGWSWWDDMESDRKIGSEGTFEHSRGIREFAALPEWRDKPALNMGTHSVNFCNVITGPVGLCYAVPLDQPRIFRTGYDADARLFYIVYDVALAPQTDPPGTAQFTFYIYRSDPDWGMRSALDRYYRLFPDYFAKHVATEGMWMAFSKLSEIDNVNEFRFAFQEGAPEPGYDDRLGVQTLTYFTHAGQFANIEDYDPETDPEPSYETQLATMREKFRQTTGSAEIFDASGLHDADGRLSIKRTAVYGHIIAQYNLDPILPYGRHMLDKIPKVFQSYRQNRGGELDGFYYDGITTGVNYRRDHFKYAAYPPTWDPVRKKPFLYNYFSSAEFAKAVAEKLHADGKITMMNGAMGSSFYTAPYLDVMGAETGLRINRSSFNYVRTICRQKPFVTLLKGNFSQLTEDDFALFMKRCTAYGVFPGFFDWPPSGLGPGSRYWDHAEWYERDRPNHRKYQALCRQLAEAGWEPLTAARSSDPQLALERFGQPGGAGPAGIFFTVLNDAPEPVSTVISIPAALLPKAPMVVDEVARRWLTDVRSNAQGLEVPLSLGPESLAVLHVVSRQQLAATHAGEIRDNLARRRAAAQLDRDRAESLVNWPGGRYGGYERDAVDGKSCMKLANHSEKQIKGAAQWVMLHQEQPTPLVLKIRLKCDQIAPTENQGGLRVDALLCHVNMKTRFTQRKSQEFDLDTGTYDWREKEIIIRPERPLRSIQLSLSLRKCPGTVWIDRVSITPVDDVEHEYVVDPAMDQWYDRPTPEQATLIEARFSELEAQVASLATADAKAIQAAHLAIIDRADTLRRWLLDHGLENAARRAVRELDDLTERLSMVSSTLMGVHGPYVELPEIAVPGELIEGRVRLGGAQDRKIDYTVEAPPAWQAATGADGRFSIRVPEDALGTTGRLLVRAAIPSPSGSALSLSESVRIRVVPALQAALRLADVSGSGDEFHFMIDAANNSQTPAEVSIKPTLPSGWHLDNPAEKRAVAPKSATAVDLKIIPSGNSKPGPYAIRVELSSAKLPKPLMFSHQVVFLPGSLNLLPDPGFEAATASSWSKNQREYEIDSSQAHSGRRSLKLHNLVPTERSSVSRTIMLNQKTARPIIVRGHAKAKNVSGHRDRGFSIYVDIYHTDGTANYGNTIDWQTGTTDWQYGTMTIEPAKPIRNVNVYLLLRSHAGTAWFDDIFVTEVP